MNIGCKYAKLYRGGPDAIDTDEDIDPYEIPSYPQELEQSVANAAKQFMTTFRNMVKGVTKMAQAIKENFKINMAIQLAEPKIRKLALHHPKWRVRKKNLSRIIREYEERGQK